jgi:hypothetical protein
MAQPDPYVPSTDFSQEEANNQGGRSTVRTAQLDAEFAAIELTTGQTLENLALIQRDDGQLRDQLVELYNLSSQALAALQARIVPRGLWSTSTVYAPYDLVDANGEAFVCPVAHTSSVFATDYAAGLWQAFNSGDVFSLEDNLASSAATDMGAGKIGYDSGLAYAAGTAGAGINDAAAAAATGIADAADAQSTADAAAAAAATGIANAATAQSTANAAAASAATGIANAATAQSDIDAFEADIASQVNAAKGAALAGYLPSWTGAVGTTVAGALNERVSASRFGLATTNTGAQNVAAWDLAIDYAIAQGGLTLRIPRGTYDFNGPIDFTGADNLRVVGDGPDATKLRITVGTGNFLTATGSNLYTSFENFTLTSSVTRTAGTMFSPGFWRRGLMHRVKITEHHDAISLPGFEQSTLSEVFIVKPSGAGTAITCGIPSASNVGANLNILNCFLRGNNELINDTPVGLVALVLYDVEAVFCVNSDFGNFQDQIMVVNPQTYTANCHFVQTFFDGTRDGDNVLITGSGIKRQFQFTGCWFNGAGQFTPGTVDCFGVNAAGSGEYYDWNFTGCRFLNTSGCAFFTSSRYMDFNFSGCVFTTCGIGAGAFKHAVLFQPTGSALKSPVITGCKFQGSGSKDIYFDTNATGAVITGNYMPVGVGVGAAIGVALTYNGCSGNYDAGTTGVSAFASAAQVRVMPTAAFLVGSGTTTVDEIKNTFLGHVITIYSNGNFTVGHATGNINLAGSVNYAMTTGKRLTLMCTGGNWHEVGRS